MKIRYLNLELVSNFDIRFFTKFPSLKVFTLSLNAPTGGELVETK